MSVFGSSAVVRLWTSAFSLRLKPQLKELYLFSLLFSFAYALVAIFEPVFLYQEGFSFSFIAVYYAIHYILYAILLPIGGMFAARVGVERSIAISLPIFVVYFLTLAAIPTNHNLVYVAAVLLTLHKILYWPSFHANFAEFGDRKNRGTELSWMTLLRYGVGILGPLAGGFVATSFGFPVLFTAAAVLVLISVVPMLRTRDRAKPQKTTYMQPWKIISSVRNRSMVWSMIGWGENLIDAMFWPIFMFIVLGTAQALGVIASITAAIMTGMSFFIGEMSDRYSRRAIIRMHVPFMVVGNLLRPLASTFFGVLLTDTLARLAFTGVNLPSTYRLYVLADRSKRTVDYMVALELVLAIAKAVVAIGLAIVFALLLPYQAFVVTFIIAAVFSILYAAL